MTLPRLLALAALAAVTISAFAQPGTLVAATPPAWVSTASAPGNPARPTSTRPTRHRVYWNVWGGVTDNGAPTPGPHGTLRAVDVGQVLDPQRGEGALVFKTVVATEPSGGQLDKLVGTLDGHVYFLHGTFLGHADLVGQADLGHSGVGADPQSGTVSFAGPMYIRGGTGRYRNAHGTLHLSGQQNQVTYGFHVVIRGTVTY